MTDGPDGAGAGDGGTRSGRAAEPVLLTPREGPFSPHGRLLVLYDGECGFCRAMVVHLRRWDRAGRLVPVPLQDAGSDGTAAASTSVAVSTGEHEREAGDPSLLRAADAAFDLALELTVIDEATGGAARGGDAILTIVDTLPGGRVLRRAWSDPPFLWAVGLGYRFVARNRSRLAAFGLDVPVEAIQGSAGPASDPAAPHSADTPAATRAD